MIKNNWLNMKLKTEIVKVKLKKAWKGGNLKE